MDCGIYGLGLTRFKVKDMLLEFLALDVRQYRIQKYGVLDKLENANRKFYF